MLRAPRSEAAKQLQLHQKASAQILRSAVSGGVLAARSSSVPAPTSVRVLQGLSEHEPAKAEADRARLACCRCRPAGQEQSWCC